MPPSKSLRERLAWAFMTLGKHPYPGGEVGEGGLTSPMPRREDGAPGSSTDPLPSGSLPSAPLPGGQHVWKTLSRTRGHHCSYCDARKAYKMCLTCESLGLGHFVCCVPKSGRDCMKMHVDGCEPRHASWMMSSPGRRASVDKHRGKRQRVGAAPSGADDLGDLPPSPSPAAAPTAAALSPRSPRLRRRMEAAQEAARVARALHAEVENARADRDARATRAAARG